MNKNVLKGESFAYAFKRIDESIANEYYLEAITLCESIISDRLLSYVSGNSKKKNNTKTPFKKIIELAQKLNKTKVSFKDESDLLGSVDLWRVQRNICVHSVAKSEPGEPTLTIEEFLKLSEKSAKDGKKLARIICDWHRGVKARGV